MENSVMRCKGRIAEVTHVKQADGSTSEERVTIEAVVGGSDENKQWCKWTPWFQFKLNISNPDAFGKLSTGHEFYIDFTPANK